MKFNSSSIKQLLSHKTSIFGLKLWVAIVLFIFLAFLLVLNLVLIFIARRYRRGLKKISQTKNFHANNARNHSSMDRRLLSNNKWDAEISIETPQKPVMYSDQCSSNRYTDVTRNVANVELSGSEMGTVGPYAFAEIEAATHGLAYQNVIGSGEYGMVFQGFFMDNTQVAVKKLFNNRSAKVGFVREVEAMLLVKHKNLVKLQGYCAEGIYRMLVYEYVDNGTLNHWLHRTKSRANPLTWNHRISIIVGIAKGFDLLHSTSSEFLVCSNIANFENVIPFLKDVFLSLEYLHEEIEPPIIHGNLKSSNILLDQKWNPKISDYGINRLLGPEWNFSLGPPTGMSGYIAPEYYMTRVLDEKSDVYSFGVLIMEIVSGKTTTESPVSEIEEYLVDWIKALVAEQSFDLIIDPELPEGPSLKELKRILLIALRCADYEAGKRPKIGEVIHMFEPRDLLLSDEVVIKRQISGRTNSLRV